MDLSALVVCPDQDSTGLLELIQSEMAMTAEHTSSISHAIELLDRNHFGVVLVDYRAGQSSEELVTHLRASESRDSLLIAIVDSESEARQVFTVGASFVLYRPLTSERTRISLRAARSLIDKERRRAPRAPLGSVASVAYPGAPELNAFLADLSEGGTSIHSAKQIPAATKVYFEFALPGQKQLVRLSGEVAWQDASGRTGIRFLDVPKASRRLMQAWLDRHAVTAAAETQDESTSAAVEEQESLHQKKSVKSLVSNAGNRRGERRIACKLGADVYSEGTNVPNRCTLSDISEGGCYVEMPTPLSGQKSGVEILVRTADTKLKIKGEVLTTHPGFGMGVRFVLKNSTEREEIMRLLGVLSVGASVEE